MIKQKMNKSKKRRFYECANYEFEYDDFGKYHQCHAQIFGENECICNRIWSMQYCLCYEKGNLRGTFKVTEQDQEDAEKFKNKIARRRKNFEDREHAEYERLKKKYG